jgi:hypothetical protein
MINFSGLSERSLFGRILRSPLALLPRGLTVPIVQGPLRGWWWKVGSGIHGYWLGSYEADKQPRFASVIRPGDIVFDIGAHVGFYSLLASKMVGPQGRVFAFEPVQRNLYYLHRHLQLNRIANVTVVQTAVGERSMALNS